MLTRFEAHSLEAQLPIYRVPVLKSLYRFILSITQGPTIWVPGLLGIVLGSRAQCLCGVQSVWPSSLSARWKVADVNMSHDRKHCSSSRA